MGVRGNNNGPFEGPLPRQLPTSRTHSIRASVDSPPNVGVHQQRTTDAAGGKGIGGCGDRRPPAGVRRPCFPDRRGRQEPAGSGAGSCSEPPRSTCPDRGETARHWAGA